MLIVLMGLLTGALGVLCLLFDLPVLGCTFILIGAVWMFSFVFACGVYVFEAV